MGWRIGVMELDIGASIALLLGTGFAVQWLAWKLRIPAILPLLLVGILVGPVAGWLDPAEAIGPFLFPLVSLAVAGILFAGAPTLRFSEVREIGRGVGGLGSPGAILPRAL